MKSNEEREVKSMVLRKDCIKDVSGGKFFHLKVNERPSNRRIRMKTKGIMTYKIIFKREECYQEEFHFQKYKKKKTICCL